MRKWINEDLFELRKKYSKNEKNLKELADTLHKEIEEMRRVEETSSRLEKNVNSQMIDIRALQKQTNKIKAKLVQKQSVNEHEKNQIRDLDTFVQASQSIFTAKVFSNIENDAKKQELLLGRSGEVLLEIARISESVSKLKENIVDIKRAEIELKDSKSVEKNKRLKEIASEMQEYNKKTVKVRYRNISGKEEICDFPMYDHLGNRIKFEQLLENACRYWDLFEFGNVLMDEDFLVWPGSKYVEDEMKESERQIWVMSKEEANYFKAIKTKEKVTTLEEEEVEETTRNLDYSEEIEDELQKEKEIKIVDKEAEENKMRVAEARNKNVLNLLIYGLFIILFTWSLLQSNQVEANFKAGQGLSNLLFQYTFPINSTTPIVFSSINLFQDFENFIKGPLASGLWITNKDNMVPYSEPEREYILKVYKKIGPTRFLQKKVKSEMCSNDYSNYLGRTADICFQDLSNSNELKSTLNIPGFPSQYSSWLNYYSESNPRTATGILRNYDMTGYVAYINQTDTYENALSQISVMVDDGWIDLQTRFLAIDSNFCNYNADICLSLEITFEFSAGGGVLPSQNLIMYRVNLLWTTQDKLRVAFDALSGTILLYFLYEFIGKVRRQGWKTAFTSFWNLLLLLLIMMIFAMQMAYVGYQQLYKIKHFNDNSTEFIDYMSEANIYKMISNFTGISSFIVYFYIMAFFQESKSLKVIWGTLAQAMYRLMFFFLVFLLVFTGWMLLAYKGFGQYLADYQNLGTTAQTLLQMLLGNVNFAEIYAVQPIFAGIFFFLFIFLDYFIMLNVFLAIINEAYDTVYKKIKQNSDSDELLIILGILVNGALYSFVIIPWRVLTCKYCRRKKSKN